MLRRPRLLQSDGTTSQIISTNTGRINSSLKRSWAQRDDTSSESEDKSDGNSSHSDVSSVHMPAGEDQNIDAPRVAQWVDEDDLENLSSADEQAHKPFDGEDASEEGGESSNLISLRNDLASLPLGALRIAQRALSRTYVDSGSEDDVDSEPEPETISHVEVKKAEKPEWSNKPRTDISKRKNKHAPTEVTSKKPVTRRRHIIDVSKLEDRDPRFLPFVGQFKPESFRKQYAFLTDMHVTETKTLKEHLKRAKKILVSSPQHLREEREQEIARLELAVKRAESSVNKDKRDRIEQEALDDITKEEREKRKAGKAAWYMKDSDKRRLLVRARYNALVADGGKGTVKKAIEKKQKKIGQKDKRKRPIASQPYKSQGEGSGSKKRRKLG